MNDRDTLIRVEGVSKRFCRDLKGSLWYGLGDLAREFTGSDGRHRGKLRKGEFFAVDNVSLKLGRGECVGLIGPNGSGKSTLLKLINGLMYPDVGRIRIRGRVGALIELTAGFNPILTGRENIYVNAAVLGLGRREVDRLLDQIIAFAEVADAIDAPVQTYSSGMKARLGFAVAAHLNPDVLLVDEVLAVGDVGFRMKCFRHILGLKERGLSIVLVTHSMVDVTRVCDRTVVLSRGRSVYQGDVSRGVAAYEEALSEPVDAAQPRPAVGRRAWIESIALADGWGNETDQFRTGDDLLVTLMLGASAPLADARIVVHVESPRLGILGSFASTHSGFPLVLAESRTEVRLTLPDLPLLVGAYSFRFALYGRGIDEFYDHSIGLTRFQVVGPDTDNFGFGLGHTFRFDHKWMSPQFAEGGPVL